MDDFASQIYSVVYQIPHGKVATYGDIAQMAGFPRYARQVGKLMASLPKDTQLPWHRVINAKGCISLTGEGLIRQRERLQAEGIEISEAGKLSLRRYRWMHDTDA
ncbi:hypothetical protein A3K86_06600 [Photobacterium jeanii]|uniref:Methylated-DNA-[protein]-cysteine S-methyltransferase DNA binding domain-containing protein n=1 Tax=Photobacterium jeanii TaxID=858640 RepID=A0A178KPS5_9GAMM|nr:MGMT family protein [Photobacterium jeanii]OAN18552.1 hypothetical protein A3K86_06600 [Photobacterium jeanii]PST91766.1 hypothetical protein C9I91_00870 [Photobacterium jeanii]